MPVPDNLIFFDGECGFCNRAVRFVLNRDPGARYAFAPLESDLAFRLLGGPGGGRIHGDAGDTLVLLESGKRYERSTAVLRIARHLSGLWPALYIFILVPESWRDLLYDGFARRRHRWFPNTSSCRALAPGDRRRFIE